MTNQDLVDSLRKECIGQLIKAVKPRLRPCGYVDDTEEDNRLRIALFDLEQVKHVDPDDEEYEIEGVMIDVPGFRASGIIGFDKRGVLVGTAPVACSHEYTELPVEALLYLCELVETVKWEEREEVPA